ncbi:MAG TPA: hypothetical protein PKM34_08460 [Bacteroidales bacterium]|jgi:hypothetical protein|nr:hypothetical protein [Bacteroidales bacterium]MDX9905281.1 hypothetical protein [Bacteroidales bacterium]HNQ83660.1 hypothetical protein [Bacteroidales bacterium]
MKSGKSHLYVLAVIVLVITACHEEWKTIVVAKGNHSSNEISPMLFQTDRIDFYFIADSSWYYPPPVSPGWNKIRGLSHGHHQNNSSARLVYQCIGNTLLVVGAYCYADGISPQQNPALKGIIDTIQPGIKYFCSIHRKDDQYIFKFEDKTWIGPAGKYLSWGYLLNPYIGGEFTLEKDWVVKIKDEKISE